MLLPILAGLIVLAGLAIGYRDLLRFRPRRVGALAGVCFAESLRRRVLWITPLAIVGVIAVSQFARPADEQDAIYQTLKYCLFASGLIVTVAAVILASTNLPREIESRVIYTIVTKPTTRLEIVLGKVLGFASVSAVILLIMGLFTWAYLELRARSMVAHINDQLRAESVDPEHAATLRHYAQTGLLATKALHWPGRLQVYSREPGPDGMRYMAGARQQYYTVPFALTDDDARAIADLVSRGHGAFLIATLDVRRHAPNADEQVELQASEHPVEGALVAGPAVPGAETRPTGLLSPRLSIGVFDAKTHDSIGANDPNYNRLIAPFDPPGSRPPPEGPRTYVLPVSPLVVDGLLRSRSFYVEVSGYTPTVEWGADAKSTRLVVMGPDGQPVHAVVPRDPERPDAGPPEPEFYARVGRSGMQIQGQPPEEGDGSLGVYEFTGADVTPGADGLVGLQLRVAVERGGDLDAIRTTTSKASVQVRNRKTGKAYDAGVIEPETSRTTYAYVPAEAVAGGDFDVVVRGLTKGQWIGLHGPTATNPSVAVIRSHDSFSFNLFKSLFILWLLSVLVVVVAIFCSTFLSWPIAIVLTLMILLGRWGVDELGDALAPGAQRTTVKDIFNPQDQATGKALTESMEGLATMLRTVAPVLPDVTTFPVIEDIHRGVSVPPAKVLGALSTLAWYGVPLIILTYLVLRNKEVAP